eukprot:jgi/Psemu1/306350/fgenesh1_kg.251_\
MEWNGMGRERADTLFHWLGTNAVPYRTVQCNPSNKGLESPDRRMEDLIVSLRLQTAARCDDRRYVAARSTRSVEEEEEQQQHSSRNESPSLTPKARCVRMNHNHKCKWYK